MSRHLLLAPVAVALGCLAAAQASAQAPAAAAAAPAAYPATLAGHAVLPAQTMLTVPKDAPADLQVSGKFTTVSTSLK